MLIGQKESFIEPIEESVRKYLDSVEVWGAVSLKPLHDSFNQVDFNDVNQLEMMLEGYLLVRELIW